MKSKKIRESLIAMFENLNTMRMTVLLFSVILILVVVCLAHAPIKFNLSL